MPIGFGYTVLAGLGQKRILIEYLFDLNEAENLTFEFQLRFWTDVKLS